MTPQDKLASFWAHECGARGPALSHTHGRCSVADHFQCPCVDCGLTPERWLSLVEPNVVRLIPPEADIEMREAGILGDDEPLQLPQPGELGVPIMERRAVRGEYGDAPLHLQALNGRGMLSPEWVEWALHHVWVS